MTFEQLHEILDNEDRKLSVKELKQVIYELKQDCFDKVVQLSHKFSNVVLTEEMRKSFTIDSSFYNGEINAFEIALDLLEHLKGD